MKDSDLEAIRTALKHLGDIIPDVGGHVDVTKQRELLRIYGNRIGMLRLGVALLRYAIDAKLISGTSVAMKQQYDEMFTSPSRIVHVYLQLEESSPLPAPRHFLPCSVVVMVWLSVGILGILGSFLLLKAIL